MRRYRRAVRLFSLLSAFLFLTGFAEIVQTQLQSTGYPEPRFPSYLKPPRSVEDIMPHARRILRSESSIQGGGMGLLKSGETALMVTKIESEEMVLEAIRRAAAERGITMITKPDYELVGLSREEVLELLKVARVGYAHPYTSEQGYMEGVGWWQGRFADREATEKWLDERRPDLAELVYGEEQKLSERLEEVQRKMDAMGEGIKAFLEAHPEVKGVYWAQGGTTGRRRAIYPYSDKYLGTAWMDNRYQVMSEIGSYPGDVWQLTEEKVLEPLAYVERIEVTDPEGTNVHADITELQAARWAQGAYQRGHLYMFPNQATGRFGYSVVDYPAFQKEWLPREPLAKLEGVIVGTKGHVGFYPRWEIHFEDGFIKEVKGGGRYGDLLRLALQFPTTLRTSDLEYPHHDQPGFWYLYEIAWGTHPKFFRHPQYMMIGALNPERLRSGVFHWGLGMELRHDPSAPIDNIAWNKFAEEQNVPAGHGFHTHTYFNTYRVRIRGADRWVTLCDKGRMSSMDDAEVRALASRYGDPDRILAEDWIDEIPGITAPGSYAEDYAPDPWKKAKAVIDAVEAGSYAHFYPER